MEVESGYISIPETARRAGIAPKTIYNRISARHSLGVTGSGSGVGGES